MSDPANEPSLMLQGAVFAKLKQSAALEEFIGERLYDQVPVRQAANGSVSQPASPYVTWGPDDVTDDSADCLVSNRITFQLDVWSRAFGRVEVKRIAGLIRNILNDEDLELTDHYLGSLLHRITRFSRDPDGLTNRASITFEALVDEDLLISEGEPSEPELSAYVLADFENGTYTIDGDAATIDDIIVENPDFGGPNPPYTLGAGGATNLSGKLSAALMPDIIAQGCTMIFDISLVAAGNASATFELWEFPGFGSTLGAAFNKNANTADAYGEDYPEGSALVLDNQRNKIAMVTVPGNRLAIAINGVMDGSVIVPAAPVTPTDYTLDINNAGKHILHSVTIYLGNLTDEQLEDLSAL